MIESAGESPAGGNGRRILVVEDNFAVAESLRCLLENEGYEVVGLAGTLERAAQLLDEVEFDVAVLDVDLHGANVAPIARRLVERSKPFLFLTGYADVNVIPPEFSRAPRLEKPADPAHILTTIDALSSAV